MKSYFIFISFALMLFLSCQNTQNTKDIETWKAEIMAVEAAFDNMAQKEGLTKAFEHYAAPDGVIKRNRKVIKGKDAIHDWYRKDVRPNETLSWTPTFVDVSSSGDLGYTYGDYIFTSTDSLGVKKESKGIFHTVWKRQKDGSWRFVWD